MFTLFFALFTLIYAQFLAFSSLEQLRNYKIIKELIDFNKCNIHFIKSSAKLIKEIERQNKIIKKAHILTLIPKTRPAGLAIKKASFAIQQAAYFFYKSKSLSSNCSNSFLNPFLKNKIYKTKTSIFIRKYDGQVARRRKVWKFKTHSAFGSFSLIGFLKFHPKLSLKSKVSFHLKPRFGFH